MDTPHESECIACNTAAAVPSGAKAWCLACSQLPTPSRRQACVKCLQQQPLADASKYGLQCKIPQ